MLMEPGDKGKEALKFPVFATNTSRDPFDFANIILHSSGYQIKLIPGVVSREGKPLPELLKVMVESENIAQILSHLYHSGTRHSTITAVIGDVGNGSPTGIFNLLHGDEELYHLQKERKQLGTTVLKKCFMRAYERIGKGIAGSLLTENERKEYEQQHDLFKKEGYQPISLEEIMALMKEEMPEIKREAEKSIQELTDFNTRKRNVSNN